jgi:hypothetical protein
MRRDRVMQLLCRIFGHDLSKGYMGGPAYLRIAPYSEIDGLNTEHLTLTNICERCGEEVIVGKLHLRPPRTPAQLARSRT